MGWRHYDKMKTSSLNIVLEVCRLLHEKVTLRQISLSEKFYLPVTDRLLVFHKQGPPLLRNFCWTLCSLPVCLFVIFTTWPCYYMFNFLCLVKICTPIKSVPRYLFCQCLAFCAKYIICMYEWQGVYISKRQLSQKLQKTKNSIVISRRKRKKYIYLKSQKIYSYGQPMGSCLLINKHSVINPSHHLLGKMWKNLRNGNLYLAY